MGYELYLIPAAPEADIEDAGEALLARLPRFTERAAEPSALPECARALEAVLRTDAALAPRDADGRDADGRDDPPPQGARVLPVVRLADPAGLLVTLARTFLRVTIPFDHRGEPARGLFERAFRVLAAAASATGWRAYDPQDAGPLSLGDDGRDGALLIYLSAMDQIRPAARP
ncbi:MAG: hypothetical protein HMLKMBBP_00373 [Planctomycetes bacterium]|nr:hypothetical protein [Planctomycetota bacterium]